MECHVEETLVHLFWRCPSAEQCWNFICPQRDRRLSIMGAFEEMRTLLRLPFETYLLILAAWGIWIIRNNKIFHNQTATFRSWKAIFYQELKMLEHRMKTKHANSYKEWLQTFV
jgi:hypothetical protein